MNYRPQLADMPPPVGAPMGPHAYLRKTLTELPKDQLEMNGSSAELAVAQEAATPGTTELQHVLGRRINLENSLPQQQAAQMPANVPGTPLPDAEDFLARHLPFTPKEKEHVSALAPRLPNIA